MKKKVFIKILTATLCVSLLVGGSAIPIKADSTPIKEETKGVPVTLDASIKQIMSSVKTGVKLTKYPSQKDVKNAPTIDDVTAVWIYNDTLANGEVVERISEDVVTRYEVSMDDFVVGNNLITVKELETGNNLTTSFYCEGTTSLETSVKKGIKIKSAPAEQLISQPLETADFSVVWIYDDIYTDGSHIERESSEVVSTPITLSPTNLSVGNNTIKVTETATGFFDTCTINGLDQVVVVKSEKTGIKILEYPSVLASGETINQFDVEVVWIYTDTYSDGSKQIRESNDSLKKSEFNLSQSVITNGRNLITVTENVTGKDYNEVFQMLGNYVKEHNKIGIKARYAYVSALADAQVQTSSVICIWKYEDIYADGTNKQYYSTDKCTNFTLSQDKFVEGDNTITVRENETGHDYTSQFSVTGKANPNKITTPATPTVPTVPTTPPAPTSTKKPVSSSSSTTKKPNSTSGTSAPALPQDAPVEEAPSASQKEAYFKYNQDIDDMVYAAEYIPSEMSEQDNNKVVKDLKALIEAQITPEDLEKLKNGEDVHIQLDVTDRILIEEEDKDTIVNTLFENEYIGRILDIKFSKYNNGQETELYAELETPLTLTIEIPKSVLEDIEGMEDITYHMIRIHKTATGEEEIERLEDLDDDPYTFTFVTNKFSMYILTFEEPLEETPELCEHIFEFVDNEDGTHTATCTKCGYKETSPCIYENGYCTFCTGTEEISDTDDSEEGGLNPAVILLLGLAAILILGGIGAATYFLLIKPNQQREEDEWEDFAQKPELNLDEESKYMDSDSSENAEAVESEMQVQQIPLPDTSDDFE